MKTTIELPPDLVLMKDAGGVLDSGVTDLGSNAEHVAGFGCDAPRNR